MADIQVQMMLTGQAARLGCYAAFHAAHALIFERLNTKPKTHGGVHRLFGTIAATETATFDATLTGFLSSAYDLKTATDYGTPPLSTVTTARAAQAIADADRFVKAVRSVIP